MCGERRSARRVGSGSVGSDVGSFGHPRTAGSSLVGENHGVLLLARHGETPDNEAELILGRRNPPLSGRGREQAARLASRALAAGVVAIWTSPLLRARQTAAVVGDAIAVEPIVFAELIESERGVWEGQSQQE